MSVNVELFRQMPAVDFVVDRLLGGEHAGMEFRLAGDDGECAPSQQAGNRIEFGGTHIATEFGGGEGDGAHAGTRVAYPQVLPEAALRDFRNPFLQRAGTGAAVGIDLRSARRWWAVDFLDAPALPALHRVIEGVEDALFQSHTAVEFVIVHARSPEDFVVLRPEKIKVRRLCLLVADFPSKFKNFPVRAWRRFG